MNPAVEVTWVVLAGRNGRGTEARLSAECILEGAASAKIIVKDFRDGYFPYTGTEMKEEFDGLGRNLAPDLILTHCRHDLHQDHRLVCELTWNTFQITSFSSTRSPVPMAILPLRMSSSSWTLPRASARLVIS